jgi:hypothetical protein
MLEFQKIGIFKLCNLLSWIVLDPPLLSIRHEPNEALMENKTYTFNCDSKSNPETNDKM